MKKSLITFVCLALLFALPFASAGFWNWITGLGIGPSDFNVSANVGGTAPNITRVDVNASYMPQEETYLDITINFSAYDHDEATDLDNTTAQLTVSKTGEASRTVSCTPTTNTGEGVKEQNYTCTARMWYWEAYGAWVVNATISDKDAYKATNDTKTFAYGSLTAFKLSPGLLQWPTLIPGQTNVKAETDPSVLNNTGNYVSNDIEINVTNLNGTGIRKDLFIGGIDIFAAMGNDDSPCAGMGLLMGEYTQLVNITGDLQLPRGNLSTGGETAQAKVYYCLTSVDSGLVKQSYTTSANGAWTMKIA